MSYIKQAIIKTLAIEPTNDLKQNAKIIDDLLEFILDNFTSPKALDQDDKECVELWTEIRELFSIDPCAEEWYQVLVKYPPLVSEAALPVALVLYIMAMNGCVNLDLDINSSVHWVKFCDIYGSYITRPLNESKTI